MGLDWHTKGRPLTKSERVELIPKVRMEWSELDDMTDKEVLDEYVPRHALSCETVCAPRAKERADFHESAREELSDHKTSTVGIRRQFEDGDPFADMGYVKYWENMTLEEYKEITADKFDCENCPLLQSLDGADSTQSGFLGVTVCSCDFRGKRVLYVPGLPDELVAEAYDEHNPQEMHEYANCLETWLNTKYQNGELKKDSYEQYSQAYDEETKDMSQAVIGLFVGPKLSRKEYEVALHPTEEAIRSAVHWLRTCADMGVWMGTSY